MAWLSTKLPYDQTGYFSEIIRDYLNGSDTLASFYAHRPSLEGLTEALHARRKYPVRRDILVSALKDQYKDVVTTPLVQKNIESLLQDHTFTVCTAHQPALFTGPLYFIYKILHTVRLAEVFNRHNPELNMVPVFFMGSEDADLEELNHIYLDNEKIIWDTHQRGAVGRMRPDGLETVLARIEGEYSVQPFGAELCELLKRSYLDSPDIQTAMFRMIDTLFGEYGLIVLIADRPEFKKQMIPVFEEDLFAGKVSDIVNRTIGDLSNHYKVQAHPRAINLFYLRDDLRSRIEKTGDQFRVLDTQIEFDRQQLQDELHRHPERFSPNVILRGLFQEMILPNIAFIGGGGETAYWLEYKNLFAHYGVPFPALILRNSFLLIEAPIREKMEKAGLGIPDLFLSEERLVNDWVKRQSQQQLSLEMEIEEAGAYYDRLKKISAAVDPTLVQHVEALQARALEPVRELEKKLLKAEKRKFKDQQHQVNVILSTIFPNHGLQERTVSFLPWYAARGKAFIRDIYAQSLTLEQVFLVLEETGPDAGA